MFRFPLRESVPAFFSYAFCVRRDDSKLTIESVAPEPLPPRAATSFQKRGLAHAGMEGLSAPGHVDAAPNLGAPLPHRAQLPRGVGKAASYVSGTPQNGIRTSSSRALPNLQGEAADIGAQRFL